jgi:triosephosphate isomerase (TIM)
VRRYFVAGNWKMNTDAAGAEALARAVRAGVADDCPVDVLVAPPFPYLALVAEQVAGSPVKVGGQNCCGEDPGAFTGEVAVEMLKDVGCSHVILGHSERRHVMGETDDLINRKVRAALAKGLNVILCIGERLEEREANETERVLDRQLAGGLLDVTAEEAENLVIAYEPVWAIGTGKVATPEQAEAAHRHVRGQLSERFGAELGEATRIQYGGSVKADNAAELLGQPNVDGALVGGASLKAEAFLPIVEAAVRLSL